VSGDRNDKGVEDCNVRFVDFNDKSNLCNEACDIGNLVCGIRSIEDDILRSEDNCIDAVIQECRYKEHDALKLNIDLKIDVPEIKDMDSEDAERYISTIRENAIRACVENIGDIVEATMYSLGIIGDQNDDPLEAEIEVGVTVN